MIEPDLLISNFKIVIFYDAISRSHNLLNEFYSKRIQNGKRKRILHSPELVSTLFHPRWINVGSKH
jgi:hypothetical protein